ncbi:MAG: TonB-dependent receptor plug domain-containing protein [Rhodospirillaceae bacterium]|nr:TonB-dependent receptor plug domain-containing protein [Rhodospirillaceae bacterium]
MRRIGFVVLLALTPIVTLSALSREPAPVVPASGPDANAAVAVYEPAFFAQYRPITLQDMLDRIPGVSLAFRATEERRGLRTNSDQILINGKQISAKDNNSATVLRRISASQVERIEVIRGAVAELEITSGRVINIVLKTEGKATPSYFLGFVGYRDGTIRPLGTVGYAYDSVDMNANVAMFSDVSYRPWQRLEINRTPAQAAFADATDTEQALNQYYRATGNFDWRLAGDRELQLNVLAQHRDIDRNYAACCAAMSPEVPRSPATRWKTTFGIGKPAKSASITKSPWGSAGSRPWRCSTSRARKRTARCWPCARRASRASRWKTATT